VDRREPCLGDKHFALRIRFADRAHRGAELPWSYEMNRCIVPLLLSASRESEEMPLLHKAKPLQEAGAENPARGKPSKNASPCSPLRHDLGRMRWEGQR
jgi:hypothetical protein